MSILSEAIKHSFNHGLVFLVHLSFILILRFFYESPGFGNLYYSLIQNKYLSLKGSKQE